MTDRKDETKEILRKLLDGVYREQDRPQVRSSDSFLIGADEQYLGKITDNQYDNQSILNTYGPYGSKYSSTSIFNPYSQYGGPYGIFSVDNPYTNTPPRLFLNGRLAGSVTRNQYLADAIPTDAFLYSLHNNFAELMHGRIVSSELVALILDRKSFIVANDKILLGKLTLNKFDNDSIFNQFGPYGNQFSQTSIYNPYGLYGGLFSQLSPFNQFATHPPSVFLKGKFAAFLTRNKLKQPSIDPDRLEEWVRINLGMFE
jgi:hypothetical protein